MLSANWINPECPYPHSQSTGMALAVCQRSLIINKWITHPYVCGLGGSWGSFRKCEVFTFFPEGLGREKHSLALTVVEYLVTSYIVGSFS